MERFPTAAEIQRRDQILTSLYHQPAPLPRGWGSRAMRLQQVGLPVTDRFGPGWPTTFQFLAWADRAEAMARRLLTRFRALRSEAAWRVSGAWGCLRHGHMAHDRDEYC